jgi:hypothetical protein
MIQIYFSHPIRGTKGNDATAKDIAENNREAKEMADALRAELEDYSVDIYVPAEHDEVLTLLYSEGKLSIEDILWADCEIVKKCQLVLFLVEGYLNYPVTKQFSRGMLVEWDCAIDNHIAVGFISEKNFTKDVECIKDDLDCIKDYMNAKPK